jgi:hypothetical protein
LIQRSPRSAGSGSDPAPHIVVQSLALVAAATAIVVIQAAAAVSLTTHPEWVDWGIYLASFLVVLPMAIAFGWLLLKTSAPRSLSLAAICAGTGVLGTLWLSRLAEWNGHERNAPEVILIAGTLVTAALATMVMTHRGIALDGITRRLERLPGRFWPFMIPLAVFASVLLFVPDEHRTVENATGAALVALAAGGLYLLRPSWSLPRPWSLILDVVVASVVLLLALDVALFDVTPLEVLPLLGDPVNGANTSRQFHSDFFLAPVNDVVHGRTLFVDTGTPYGVGSIYFLALVFQIVPLGYGGFGLVMTFLLGVQHVIAYAVLRIAGVGPVLSAATVGVSVAIALMSSTPVYSPSLGALRFGLPLLFLLLVLWRGPGKASSGGIPRSGLAVLGLSAVWSVEAFLYTAGAFLAATVVYAGTSADLRSNFAGYLGRAIRRGLLVCFVAVSLLVVASLVRAREIPDVGWYAGSVQGLSGEFASEPVGAWSPVWALGACYMLSIAGLTWLTLARPALVRRNPPLMTAIAVSATIGIGFLTYHINRSVDQVLPMLSLPALMLVGLWVHALLDETEVPRRVKAVTVGAAAWLLGLILLAASPLVKETWPRTALSHAAPGGESLRYKLSGLWESPRIDPRSMEVERLIERFFPGDNSPLILAEPDLTTEALMQTGRANRLPISFVSAKGIRAHWEPMLNDAISEIHNGEYAIVQHHRPGELPSGPLFAAHTFGQVMPGRWLNASQRAALHELRERFRFSEVATGRYGLEVVLLVERPGAPQD